MRKSDGDPHLFLLELVEWHAREALKDGQVTLGCLSDDGFRHAQLVDEGQVVWIGRAQLVNARSKGRFHGLAPKPNGFFVIASW